MERWLRQSSSTRRRSPTVHHDSASPTADLISADRPTPLAVSVRALPGIWWAYPATEQYGSASVRARRVLSPQTRSNLSSLPAPPSSPLSLARAASGRPFLPVQPQRHVHGHGYELRAQPQRRGAALSRAFSLARSLCRALHPEREPRWAAALPTHGHRSLGRARATLRPRFGHGPDDLARPAARPYPAPSLSAVALALARRRSPKQR